MEIGKAQSGLGLQTVTDAQIKNQETQNAVNQFQSKYGEKPKEARAVKKALDKDDFMRIMITEMKHQDPTKPMDSDRMATQMAQVTSVEQMKNVASAVDKLAEKSNATDRLAMSSMIGKTVTVDKGRFVHQKGTVSAINFDLPENAEKIKLSIQNEKGEEIASRELEPKNAGPNTYNWDGINASSIQSTTGTYLVRVEAEGAGGKKLKVDPITKEEVVGVTFEGGDTNFLVGDPKNPQKVAFKSVSRIEGEATMKASTESKAAAAALQAKVASVQAQKAGLAGNGSQNGASNGAALSGVAAAGDLPLALQEKVKAELAKSAPVQAQAEANAPDSPGFPNGLRE